MQVRGLKAWHSHVVRYLGVMTPTELKQLNEDSLRTMAAAAQMTLDSALIARVLKAIRLTDGEVAAATLEPSEPGSARSTVASEDGWEGTPRSVQWPSGVDFSKIDSVICKLFDRFDDEKAAREAFSRLDRARSKRLSASDLRNGLKNEYQIRTDENMAVYLVAALDGDGDRRLCAQDFAYGQKLARLGFLRRKIRAFTTAKYNNDLAKHFHAMCGATDTLSFPKFKQEIRTRAKVSPSQMSEPELREIFSFFDTDVNSCIDWDEFDAVMSDGALSKIPRPNIRAAVASSFRPSAGSVAPAQRPDLRAQERKLLSADEQADSPVKWEDSLQRPGTTAFRQKMSKNGPGQPGSPRSARSNAPTTAQTEQQREAEKEAERLARLCSGAVVSLRFVQAGALLDLAKTADGKSVVTVDRHRRKGEDSTQNVVVRLKEGIDGGDRGADGSAIRSGDQVVIHFLGARKYLAVDEQHLELNGLATRPPPLSAPLTISLWDDEAAIGSGSGSDADGNGSARPLLHFGDAVTLRSCNGAHFECTLRNQAMQVGARSLQLPDSPRGAASSSPYTLTLENRTSGAKKTVPFQRRAATSRMPLAAAAPAAGQLLDVEDAASSASEVWADT